MNNFKYILFPDQTYIITFEGFDGKPFKAEVPGIEIVQALRRSYALDKFIEELDKESESGNI
jgi:hypothetical protein